jgi:hypothetical protein
VIRVDQNWSFGHVVDVAKFIRARRAAEKIDKYGVPFKAGQFQRQCGFVGISAFAKAMQI